ncbi:MAG: IMP dehydrogenase, partial [Limisphaerales bacterium]
MDSHALASKKNGLVQNDKFIGEGLTFDDVLLVPAYSEVLPREVNTSSRITRNITVNVPIVAAAMDTVTEHELAVAMARTGGIGILHKNMSIEAQAAQVRKVKRSESGMILDPVTLRPDATLNDALQLMKEHKIGGIPIINSSNQLVGILTNRDLRFETELGARVDSLMTKDNLIIAPVGTNLQQAENILKQHKIEKLPVVNKSGELSGLITYKDILKVQNNPQACKDKYGRLVTGAAVGISHDTYDRIDALRAVGV